MADAGRKAFLPALAAGAVFAAALLWQAAAVRETTSATFDEVTFLNAGLPILRDGDFGRLVAERSPPLPLLLADWAAVRRVGPGRVTKWELPPLVAEARRAYSIVVGVPLVLVVVGWLTLRRGWVAGAVGGGLTAFSPAVLAHASLATTDACFTLFVLVALAAMTAYQGRPTRSRYLAVGVSLGLALASKQSAVFLLAVVVRPLVASSPGRGMAPRLARAAVGWVGCLAVAFVVAWALYGFTLWPLDAGSGRARSGGDTAGGARFPAPVVTLVSQYRHGLKGHDTYLLGARSRHGWWQYFPVAFAVKSTPAELVLAAWVAALLVRGGVRGDRAAGLWAVSLGVYLAATLASPLNLGHRYLLPVYPLLVLLGVDGLARRLGSMPRTFAAVGAALVAWQAASAVWIGPHYLSYFNEASGGPRRGAFYLVDSNLDWGQDLPALREELRRLGADRVMLSYFGRASPEAYGVRTEPWAGADEALAAGCRYLAVSRTLLHGVYLRDDPFAGLRDLPPAGRAGHSIVIYDLKDPAVRVAFGDACRRLGVKAGKARGGTG